jgi:uncharacterized protein involved in cysteine biosynthesis
MLASLLLAIRQLPEREMRRPLLLSLLWSAGLFAALWLGIGWAVAAHLGDSQMLGWVAALLGVLAAPVVTWLLFPSVATTVAGFYAESVIRAVESRHYPALPPPPPTGWGPVVASAVRLAVLGLAANLVVLPLYLMLPGLNLFLFLAVNGYLVGRGQFDTVALRRLEGGAARRVWRDHRMAFILTGAVSAGLFLVPFVNLIAPILGTAATVHLFNRVS